MVFCADFKNVQKKEKKIVKKTEFLGTWKIRCSEEKYLGLLDARVIAKFRFF
jgi:hypothetical protein